MAGFSERNLKCDFNFCHFIKKNCFSYHFIFLADDVQPWAAFLIHLFLSTVYATMRNTSKAEPLVEAAGRTLGRTLEIKQLDVCDENSIKACVDSLPERRVDILSKSAKECCFGIMSIFFQHITMMTFSHSKQCWDGSDWTHRVSVHWWDENRHGHQLLRAGAITKRDPAWHEEEEKRPYCGDKQRHGHPGSASVLQDSICLWDGVSLMMSFSLLGILFNDVYAASKFAVEGFCESLAVQALRFSLK